MSRILTAAPPPPAGIDLATHAFYLDFDGTLVPIVARPQDVRLAPGTRQLLQRLTQATGGAVALISGRGLPDLRLHLQGLTLALSGSHGHETFLPGAPPQPAGGDAPALDAALEALAPLAQADDLLIERKAGAVALHYRNRPERAEACREAVTRAAAEQGLRVMHGNRVSEAVLPGVDKGAALRNLHARPPFTGRIPVMIGDDTTDEDGFRAAQDMGGFGLRIGGVPTLARHCVPDMQAALDWLEAVLRAQPARR